MAKILDVNGLLDAASDLELPDLDKLRENLEHAATDLANALAAHLNIETSGANYEQGFGGLCASFYATSKNQACPDVIDNGDPEGDWSVS